VPQLNKITITPGQPPRIAPIAPQDRREIGRGLAFLGGNGSAAAAPEPGNDAGTMATNNLTASTNTLPSTPALNDMAVADMTTPALPSLAPTQAVVSGTLGMTNSNFDGINFGFQIALSGGAITNGTVNGTVFSSSIPMMALNLSNGSGTYSPSGSFTVMNYSGTYSVLSTATGPYTPTLGSPGGTYSPATGTDLSGVLPDTNVGTSVSGSFILYEGISGYNYNLTDSISSGSVTGHK
jgi:hypothetical protein